MVIVVLATRVALTGLPSPSVSRYTTNRAAFPRRGSGVAVVVGQAIWMPLRSIGYEPPGGVKRFSQIAALSPAVLPKPIAFSREPSSSTKLSGAFGPEARSRTGTLPGLSGE